DRVLLEFYPKDGCYPGQENRVFAYQFISTEARNVGTWIPDVATEGVNFQPGFDGRGRPYPNALVNGEVNGPSERIDWMIQATMVTEVDPGECTERYRDGWRRAEESLRHGAHPDDDGPAN